MIQYLFSNLLIFIKSKDRRSKKAARNVFETIVYRGLSMLSVFAIVPLTIEYVNKEQYGIWITLYSIVAWISMFDVGLTQGLRNKVAEAIAKNEISMARSYVSTAYGLLLLIFLLVFIFFFFFNFAFDWSVVFPNLDFPLSGIRKLMVIISSYFCLLFVLRTLGSVLTANQEPAKAAMIESFCNCASFIVIFFLVHNSEGSLFRLAYGLCLAPVVVHILAHFWFFNKGYKKVRPSYKLIKLKYVNNIFRLGSGFFIIQIASLIQFETSNFIIARYFGSSSVTEFNIAFRYFSILSVVFSIIIAPFWSACTEAFLKSDFAWIKKGIKFYKKVAFSLILVGFVMFIFSKQVYELWIGPGVVNIPLSLSFSAYAYFSVSILGTSYISFLNGISAIKIQFVSSLFSPFLYGILVYYFISHLGLGIYALLWSSILANFYCFIIAPYQFHMIVNKKKTGFWIK